MADVSGERHRMKLANFILQMTDGDLATSNRIGQRVVEDLDRLERLTDKEEQIVTLAIAIAVQRLREEGLL